MTSPVRDFAFLLRNSQNNNIAASAMPAATPTAIPAMLPLDNPETSSFLSELDVLVFVVEDVAVAAEGIAVFLVAVLATLSIVLNAFQSLLTTKIPERSWQQVALSSSLSLSQQTLELLSHCTIPDP